MATNISNGVSAPDGAPRIAVLDILRGLAILGILFMNINDMGATFRGTWDIRHFGWSQADQVTWWIREIFANGTARCLLEMLFGAGMVILTERVAKAAGAQMVMRRYYVRNLVLFAFGMVHVFILLWPGDILHTYGLAALIAFWFRRLRPRWLITIGLIMAMLQLFGGGYFGYYQGVQNRAEIAALQAKRDAGRPLAQAERKVLAEAAKDAAERKKNRAESAAEIVKEDKDRSSTTANWAAEQTRMSVERVFGFGELFAIWEATSLMLIGAALFKLGIMQGNRSRRYYLWLTLVTYGVGLTLRAIGAYEQTRFDDAPHTIWATEEIARQATTLGHIGLVNWLTLSVAGAAFLRPLVAAGRTALSIYIVQTIICLWILYPPFALGLYGDMTWSTLMLTAVVINLVLLWGANVYLRHYAIGPVEWAWRSLIEWRALPFRKVQRASVPPAVSA